MKKILICLLLLLVTTSCTNNEEVVEFNVVSATGAPGLSFAQMFSQDDLNTSEANFNLEYKDGSTSLMAAFSDEETHAIVAPINLGAKFYNSNQEFVYAATLTWGNIYIAAITDDDFTMEDLRDKTVYTFGTGSVPYIVVEDILQDYNVTLENLGDSTSYTSAKLIADKDSIVMIAEPILSVVSTTLSDYNIKTIDVQEEYSKKNNTTNYPQAGLFIRSDFISLHEDIVDYFLEKLEISTSFVNEYEEETIDYVQSLSSLYSQSKDALVSAISRSNVMYKTAKESKDDAEILFNIILESSSSAIIGGVLPDEGFYYY